MIKLKRLRQNSAVRNLISETDFSAKDLVMPCFVIEGKNKKEPVESMPGIYRLSIDNLIKDIKEARDLGIKAALLFGVTGKKDNEGTEAYNANGIIQKAIKEIKGAIRDTVIITDVCLCGYTPHGHCGILKTEELKNERTEKPKNQKTDRKVIVDNDETLKVLARIAVSHAEAGADLVAPSAMMDGQVKAIRAALDDNGFEDTGILAYSAKYASNFYGPFRDAADSAPQFGDRKAYQIDFRNSDEALREIREDIREGADIVMVKPALAYLDIIRRAKDTFNCPLAAYNVSGEYAIVKAYSKESKSQRVRESEVEKNLTLEILTGIKRAGADLIVTYHAKEAAKWLMG